LLETFYNEIAWGAGRRKRNKDLHRGHRDHRGRREEKSKSEEAKNAIQENGVPGEAKRDGNAPTGSGKASFTEGRTQRTQRRREKADPFTARPDAPESGAKEKSVRSGRDDRMKKDPTRHNSARRNKSGRSGPSFGGQAG